MLRRSARASVVDGSSVATMSPNMSQCAPERMRRAIATSLHRARVHGAAPRRELNRELGRRGERHGGCGVEREIRRARLPRQDCAVGDKGDEVVAAQQGARLLGHSALAAVVPGGEAPQRCYCGPHSSLFIVDLSAASPRLSSRASSGRRVSLPSESQGDSFFGNAI